MSVKSEYQPRVAQPFPSLPTFLWLLYTIYLLFIAYLAIALILVVASCSILRSGPAVPAPTPKAVETPLIAPVPDEGRVP